MASDNNSYSTHKWWKEAVVYQVYPASFKSTGSGTEPGWGDVRGITSKLDYLKHLGVDVLWVSPIYKSPQIDMGYDISDYEDIDPRFGTLEDVDEMIKGLKERGMKLVMDFVANHTSDQHDWFLDSRSSKTSTKRDWYIWQPAKYDADGNRQPPNNWGQILGDANSAWVWDEETQEYFLALFTPEQPDLNWRNNDVRKAIHDVLRFWLERGCSGFRMDVINHISKVAGYPDAPITHPGAKYQPAYMHYSNGPHMHEYIHEMHDEVISKYDAMTVGEMPFVKEVDEIMRSVGANEHELNMIFIFAPVDIDNVPGERRLSLQPWPVDKLRRILSDWQTTMYERNGWNSLFAENHDQPRSVTRYCDDSDEWRDLGAKLLCLMQTTLGGTLYVYQGEEIGMHNVPVSWPIEEYKDIETLNYWRKVNADHPDDEKEIAWARKVIQRKARDHARTPVQWNAEANAGFCDEGTTPWMRVNDDYKTVNAAVQRSFSSSGDELSTLQYWQRGLENRKKHKEVFVYGSFELLDEKHETVFAYKRASESEAFVVALNFSGKEAEWDVPAKAKVQAWVAGNYSGGKPEKGTSGKISLRPWEGVLGKSLLIMSAAV